MLARLRKSMDEKEQGFTLIELLVVIIIIGILAAIAIPIFLNQRKKAVDAGVKSDVKTTADALETWAVDNPSTTYPAGTMGTTAMTSALGNVPLTQNNVIVVTANSATKGYCIKGSNPNGNADGSTSGGFFWYDSTAGGLQPGSGSAASPSAGAAGASC